MSDGDVFVDVARVQHVVPSWRNLDHDRVVIGLSGRRQTHLRQQAGDAIAALVDA